MVEAALVAGEWDDVLALTAALQSLDRKPLVVAVFASDEGDWRLVAVIRDVDVTGTRPIYRELDERVQAQDVPPSLIPRLLILDLEDPDARSLVLSSVEPVPVRHFAAYISALPNHRGAVIHRDSHALRSISARRLEFEVAAALSASGLVTHLGVQLTGGARVDFVVEDPSGRAAAVDAVVADRKKIRPQVTRAAGIANLAGMPVVLVAGGFEEWGGSARTRHGVVPVFLVNWSVQDPTRLLDAIAAAWDWVAQPDLAIPPPDDAAWFRF